MEFGFRFELLLKTKGQIGFVSYSGLGSSGWDASGCNILSIWEIVLHKVTASYICGGWSLCPAWPKSSMPAAAGTRAKCTLWFVFSWLRGF